MDIYINASSSISPQNSFDEYLFLNPIAEYKNVYMQSIEPAYGEYIDSKLSRRMSRIIKMGVTAVCQCLRSSKVQNPDAIITGTGMGCLEDTTKFLSAMIENEESLLTPTSFIQSTHNTIGGQIALLLNCHNYNFTYVHRAVSFETALIDAVMMIEEGNAKNVLLGGLDEINKEFYQMGDRVGQWKKADTNNLNLISENTAGTIAGEGAAFFLLSNEKTLESKAKIKAVHIFSGISDNYSAEEDIREFLRRANTNLQEVDLILMGNNGDANENLIYGRLKAGVFSKNNTGYFKHLCGEYHTASAFALWLAVKVIHEQTIPEIVKSGNFNSSTIKNILIYNQAEGKSHSLMLVSQC